MSAAPSPTVETQVEQWSRSHAGRVRPRPLAAPEQLGSLGGAVRRGASHGAAGLADDPETVEEAKANPEVFAHKTVGRWPTTTPR